MTVPPRRGLQPDAAWSANNSPQNDGETDSQTENIAKRKAYPSRAAEEIETPAQNSGCAARAAAKRSSENKPYRYQKLSDYQFNNSGILIFEMAPHFEESTPARALYEDDEPDDEEGDRSLQRSRALAAI